MYISWSMNSVETRCLEFVCVWIIKNQLQVFPNKSSNIVIKQALHLWMLGYYVPGQSTWCVHYFQAMGSLPILCCKNKHQATKQKHHNMCSIVLLEHFCPELFVISSHLLVVLMLLSLLNKSSNTLRYLILLAMTCRQHAKYMLVIWRSLKFKAECDWSAPCTKHYNTHQQQQHVGVCCLTRSLVTCCLLVYVPCIWEPRLMVMCIKAKTSYEQAVVQWCRFRKQTCKRARHQENNEANIKQVIEQANMFMKRHWN